MVMGKYKTVVIDFPWKLTPHGSDNFMRRDIKHNLPYKQMTDREILSFNINNFADMESCLFVWSTHLKLPIALKFCESNGFKYHCVLTWHKNTGVTMRGFYRNTELLLFAYRGSFPIENRGKSIPLYFHAKTRGHSVKPNEFYELIKNKTREPRIDVFARKRHEGFDAYGDEVESE